MILNDFFEDNFGTSPRRAARAGARHPRGHTPVERYHTVKEFAPGGGGDSGNYLRALASAWYNDTFNTGSLQKGIKSQEDVERVLARGIVCGDGKTRKYNIGYNSDFDGVVIYSDDYYEHGDESGDVDSRTGQPWGPWDHMEFKDEELDEQQLDELSFLGSQCTKDCSGHRAGYNWSAKKGNVHAASWSPSFNKGAALRVAGK